MNPMAKTEAMTRKVKTREDAIQQLKECHTGDTEADHGEADDIICNLLATLGYEDVVTEWRKVPKWYA